MIKIGLTTWTDHPYLSKTNKAKISLPEYTDYFSIVEIDSSFYALPKLEWVQKWLQEVPDDFQFIVKANYQMTKTPLNFSVPNDDENLKLIFMQFKKAFSPMLTAGKLTTVLFQFSASFICTKENVQYLRQIRNWMGDIPISIEFRNRSWSKENVGEKLENLLNRLNMTYVIVDEPHRFTNGVPCEPIVTNQELIYLRLHGRNEIEWQKGTRERYRYKYSEVELNQLAKLITKLKTQAHEIVVIFNNNTGKDAAKNAMSLKEILYLKPDNLTSKQLDLF